MTFYVNLFSHVLTTLILESSEGHEEEKKECNLWTRPFWRKIFKAVSSESPIKSPLETASQKQVSLKF